MIAKDYFQLFEIVFNKSFALIAHLDTIRTLFAHIAHKGWLLYQFDVKSTFLNGGVEWRILCTTLTRFFVVHGNEDKVDLLNKKLYSLKQASRTW